MQSSNRPVMNNHEIPASQQYSASVHHGKYPQRHAVDSHGNHEQLSTEIALDPRKKDGERHRPQRSQHLPRRRAVLDSLWASGDADSLPVGRTSCRPPPHPPCSRRTASEAQQEEPDEQPTMRQRTSHRNGPSQSGLKPCRRAMAASAAIVAPQSREVRRPSLAQTRAGYRPF